MSTRWPARASSMAVAAPAHRAPTMTTSNGDGGMDAWIMVRAVLAESSGNVLRQHARVAADAIYECRPARSLEPHPHRVDARERRDAALMTQLTLRIEQRNPQPGIVATVACGPDDGLDAGRFQVELCRRIQELRPERFE